MVPVVDMLNHHPKAQPGDFSETLFSTKAAWDYAPGEQAYISYGPKTNAELLQTYGFLMENNPSNGLELQFGLRPDTNVVHSIVQPILNKNLYVVLPPIGLLLAPHSSSPVALLCQLCPSVRTKPLGTFYACSGFPP